LLDAAAEVAEGLHRERHRRRVGRLKGMQEDGRSGAIVIRLWSRRGSSGLIGLRGRQQAADRTNLSG
jgi:hypothetical protein